MTTCTKNVYIGLNAGKGASDGSNTASGNIGLGSGALKAITTGGSNICFGHDCAETLTTGEYNIAMGGDALKNTATSVRNICIGRFAGSQINTDGNNTLVGYQAGKNATSGNNVMIGFDAGVNVTSGKRNTLIGYDSGTGGAPSGNITTADKIVCIGDSTTSAAYCASSWSTSSDKRDKTDIVDFTYGLSWIKQLNPVTYRWDRRVSYNELNEDGTLKTDVTPDGTHKEQQQNLGFLAQDVLEIEKGDGFGSKKEDMLVVALNEDDSAYSLRYERLVPVLVNAVKELSAKVEALEAKLA